ncbi:hypothetical protein TMatcc_001528 [Talaromyces marneffei ATCC 18224]|uniref:Wbp11/ELF5/Saf1 N-terminal domain-containing protein n=2 Tax=Talaromyces marneffei TaxID=37727 RepID=B6QH40_TALMQ|nr:uncharacterized protein EYB26_007244 [Talaromyces marneffei]EEA22685.1 conserved hypothetical protein [Talaromyces marneffei ATCC 18224]KAE8551574.1 hypothetical protein EYB25_005464 [Talaromyces marneffei]QGA19555.1 hypothetical protein EYB26_007244 [Talaromyces marneffei]
MPKDKERSINPAQAQRKLEKQKALKKGKAEAVARRNEKLARRNPERIQRQINDLKGIEESGQPLRPREKQILEELERDLRAVQKAREALGDKAPQFARAHQQSDHANRQNVLGKRRREDGGGRQQHWRHDQESDGSDTDESVRNIPMPRDTPPPIPHEFRRRGFHPTTATAEGEQGPRQPHALPAKPEAAATARTVYESAPVIRDLRQEAVSKFVPAAVRRQQDAIRGQGRLVEPEEMDRLEKAGYVPTSTKKEDTHQTGEEEDPEEILRRIEEETRAQSSNKKHTVDVEEVTDEDDM